MPEPVDATDDGATHRPLVPTPSLAGLLFGHQTQTAPSTALTDATPAPARIVPAPEEPVAAPAGVAGEHDAGL